MESEMLLEWIDKSKGYNKNILISEIRKSGLNPLSLGIHSVISTALKFKVGANDGFYEF